MNRAWLKAPSHKRAERRVIEDNVSCAFKHSSSRDIAGLTVDLKESNATAYEMPRTSFERMVWSWRRDCDGFSLSLIYRDCR